MKSLKENSPTEIEKAGPKSIAAQLFSPATGLAILGTVAFIFSFYRAGQLSNLVIPGNEINKTKDNKTALKQKPKIDINSQAVVEAADSSEASMYVLASDYKQAVEQALKDLTNNPPDNLPTILEAGDIMARFGTDKELAFGLLERAVTIAPNNQYIALRYCQRLISAERLAEAEPKLVNLIEKFPQWPDPKIVLSKLHFEQEKIAKATTELVELSSLKNLNSKQAKEIALMLAKVGRAPDGFNIFRQALTGDPKNSFFAGYCQDWVNNNPDSYDTVLAIVKANLAENKNSANVSKQLGLEIKHIALLLLLGRAQDALMNLEPTINTHPKNFDLYLLQAAAYLMAGDQAKAKTSFDKAANFYQPQL